MLFVGGTKWIKKYLMLFLNGYQEKKGGRVEPIPIEEMRYAPHIGINGERVINGCGWSILYNK